MPITFCFRRKGKAAIVAPALWLLASLGAIQTAGCDSPPQESTHDESMRTESSSPPMKIAKDIAYRKADGWDQGLSTLDVYYQKMHDPDSSRPVIVFIHGGGWHQGDKSYIGKPANRKVPQHFVKRGYVFVALNFRLPLSKQSPGATISDMTMDIAQALKWLTQNAMTYGGRRTDFIVWGYSSGAHLATLLATDSRYLDRHGLAPDTIAGVIAMDVPHYDVPESLEFLRAEKDTAYEEGRLEWLHDLFGDTPAEQKKLSPIYYIDDQTQRTPFLLITGGLNRDKVQTVSYDMTTRFKEKLDAAGVSAKHSHFPDLDHTALIRSSARGPVAVAIDEFLEFLRKPDR